jgi:hypothetical protein
MAKDKTSFVLYSDSKSIIDLMSNEDAGLLLKTLFAYVNDENPIIDKSIALVFEMIKLQLKRDLKKWEQTKEGRSIAGKASAEAKRLAKLNQQNPTNSTNVDFVQQTTTNSTVSDSVSVSVNDINKNSLLSEIKISDVDEDLKQFYDIALNFQQLFIKNLKEKNAPTKQQENATFKKYVDPIRLMIKNNECTIENLREVYAYLNSPRGEFWKTNILSTETLRKQITKLVMSSKLPEFKPKKEDKL